MAPRHRKALLKRALDFHGAVRYTQHRNEEGETYWKDVAKDATSPYVHSRSTSWLKFKCVHRQEFVVVGFTDPQASVPLNKIRVSGRPTFAREIRSAGVEREESREAWARSASASPAGRTTPGAATTIPRTCRSGRSWRTWRSG